MKRFFIIMFATLVAMVSFTSCNSEKKVMEESLISVLKAPSTYKFIEFNKINEITLADEVADRLEYFNRRLDFSKKMVKSDSSSVAFYKRMNKTYGGYKNDIKQYEDEYNKDLAEYNNVASIVSYLANIPNNYPNEYNGKTFTEYSIIYESANGFGIPMRGECVGRFNTKGEMVAIKYDTDSEWVLLGHYFSIPNYYEIID